MPELPEVETIKLQLEKFILGSTIEKVEVRNQKYNIDSESVVNQKIIGIRRFAKVLSLDLSNNISITIHVKMTGQLIYKGEKNISDTLSKKITGGLGGKHTHLIFYLNDGILYFNDVRKFGWIKLSKSDQITNDTHAPEPLNDLTLEKFEEILSKSNRNIKVVLMDQGKIGGVGNIYANDALWLSKINPKLSAKQLSGSSVKQLYEALHIVLKAGLKYGGASELSFVTPDGSEGQYQNHTLVYGHEGEVCKNPACRQAGAIIEKFFLGGRGTYWCSVCQND